MSGPYVWPTCDGCDQYIEPSQWCDECDHCLHCCDKKEGNQMNLTEKVKAKLDVMRKAYCDCVELCVEDDSPCGNCRVNFTLRRQVEKHTMGKTIVNEFEVCNFCFMNDPISFDYPCAFITEVAPDLGISE